MATTTSTTETTTIDTDEPVRIVLKDGRVVRVAINGDPVALEGVTPLVNTHPEPPDVREPDLERALLARDPATPNTVNPNNLVDGRYADAMEVKYQCHELNMTRGEALGPAARYTDAELDRYIENALMANPNAVRNEVWSIAYWTDNMAGGTDRFHVRWAKVLAGAPAVAVG
jgi:hypothetical protein